MLHIVFLEFIFNYYVYILFQTPIHLWAFHSTHCFTELVPCVKWGDTVFTV